MADAPAPDHRPELDELVKLDLKVFARGGGEGVAADEFIPVFHRWITEGVLADELLIDVADYSHVPDGPGVLLVGHDAMYAWDLGRGEPGLLCSRRRETGPRLQGIRTLEERIRSLLDCALLACSLLEAEPQLSGRVSFDRGRFELSVNDRLAPRDDATAATLAGALRRALRAAGVDDASGAPLPVETVGEPRERLTLRVG